MACMTQRPSTRRPDGVGAGMHVLDLLHRCHALAGRAYEHGRPTLQLADMTRSIPTRIKVIDINGDGLQTACTQLTWVASSGAFDISNGNPAASLVAGGVIAQLGAEGLATPGRC